MQKNCILFLLRYYTTPEVPISGLFLYIIKYQPQWRAAKIRKGRLDINTLVIKLDARNISLAGGALPTSHSQNYDRCMFMFSPEWNSYTKTAVFWQDKDVRYEMTLDDADSCDVPNEVQQQSGFMFIGVIGRSGNVILASKILVVPVNDGTDGGNANTEITQSLYDQILSGFDSYVTQARSAASEAAAAAEYVKNAVVNTPYIGADLCWYIWDSALGEYISTGVHAKGEKGDDGIGTGDMERSVYDIDGDGVVDNACSLGGISSESYATKEYVLAAIEESVGSALEGSY